MYYKKKGFGSITPYTPHLTLLSSILINDINGFIKMCVNFSRWSNIGSQNTNHLVVLNGT